MIDLEEVSMHYGNFVAVETLSLHVPQGELFAFLGPNGAGKTTTIKMLTGLLRPTGGRVRICGIDMETSPVEAKSGIGFVPDVAVFYEKLTAREFMFFIADIFGVSKEAALRGCQELFARFELEEYAERRIEALSHGIRQRLAIVAALLHEPRVLIIDEPMIGLDPLHARTVKRELRARSREGMTVFMSTHLLNVAEEVADRIGIIDRGKLIALGTMEQLVAKAEGGQRALEEIFLSLVGQEGEENRGG